MRRIPPIEAWHRYCASKRKAEAALLSVLVGDEADLMRVVSSLEIVLLWRTVISGDAKYNQATLLQMMKETDGWEESS